MSDSSPMMQQYERIKAQHQDSVLFFRMGDFYEMFRHDAVEVSRILSLTLTQRAGVQMCGIPYHAAQNYIQRLLAAGKKIAICEQTSLPGKGKGLVDRAVVQILSPGTITDDSYLGGAEPNFMLSFSVANSSSLGIASMDISTGDLAVRLAPLERLREVVLEELASRLPREILVQESLLRSNSHLADIIAGRPDLLVNRYPDWHYDTKNCSHFLSQRLGTQSLQAFGLEPEDAHLHALSALLTYAQDAARHSLDHIRSIRVMRDDAVLRLDETSIRNLELIRNLRDGGRGLSLLWVLDQTKTPMGARLLRQWILEPSRQLAIIKERHSSTELLYRRQSELADIRVSLSRMYDAERLCARISLEKAGPKDCVALARSVEALSQLAQEAKNLGLILLQNEEDLAKALLVASRVKNVLADEPPYHIQDGAAIRDGADARLDELRSLSRDSQEVLDRYLEDEAAKHNLTGLKIGQNRIIGYYLELSRGRSEQVPDHFIRKHSTLHSERFTTKRLQDLEAAIEGAGEEARLLEQEIFILLRKELATNLDSILCLSSESAELDVLAAFAYQATIQGYVRPRMNDQGSLCIKGGRHPVVEVCVDPGTFVPNDINLGKDEASLMLLTGPNMAGKSTYLRQTALIVLMAHIGSFVPAEEADIGICDRIFCRVGASDNLAGGESTFLVEMHETAAILRGASHQSLIIMDEVGRGTSTRDGLSIAWAVLEHIVHELRCRSLFATHFHELTALSYPGMKNYSLAVAEDGKQVVFLRKVKEGPSDHSYGIHVAALAGVPVSVTMRASELLASLQGLGKEMPALTPPEKKSSRLSPGASLDLFSKADQLEQLVKNFPLDSSTPLAALTAIAAWKKVLED